MDNLNRKIMLTGLLTLLVIGAGIMIYISEGKAELAGYGIPAGFNNAVGQAVGYFPDGGGCCGGSGAIAGEGSGTASAGGCGMAGAGDISSDDLEAQALEKYKEEKGEAEVRAEVSDFGCHIQIDIIDKGGEVLRSYGYQGGPLYVIK
ncbi:MAG: hypothetical protein CVU89_12780 [Firmicutes bacterium HGW-Firmicutes-14]|nr:MAG: hypothetical protein CVU89_12780 [Firmicutes bacterium HGW-Firmicutes-14]